MKRLPSPSLNNLSVFSFTLLETWLNRFICFFFFAFANFLLFCFVAHKISVLKNLLSCFNHLIVHVSAHGLQRAKCMYTFTLGSWRLRSKWGVNVVLTLLGFLFLGREIFCHLRTSFRCSYRKKINGFTLSLSARDVAFCHFMLSPYRLPSATFNYFSKFQRLQMTKYTISIQTEQFSTLLLHLQRRF